MTAVAPHRTFVPANLDPADWNQVRPLYEKLLNRPLKSPDDLEAWLADFSELAAVMDEYEARRYIDKSCHTDDPAIEKAYLHYVENIDPNIKPLMFKLKRKFLDSPARSQLTGQRHAILERNWRADVELFRDENVPLEVQVTKLTT